jgi:hypothetical protein
LLDTFRIYLGYWGLPFLASFLSPAGIVGLATGFYCWFQTKKKSWLGWVLFFLVILMPLVELFDVIKVSWMIRLVLLATPYLAWSLYGFYFFSKKQNRWRYPFLILLMIVSSWYILVISNYSQALRICLQ